MSEVSSSLSVEFTDELEELLLEELLLEETFSAGTEDVELDELEVLTEELDELTEELDVDVLPDDELEVAIELSVTFELEELCDLMLEELDDFILDELDLLELFDDEELCGLTLEELEDTVDELFDEL